MSDNNSTTINTAPTQGPEETWGQWTKRVYNKVSSHVEVAVDALYNGPNAKDAVTKNYQDRMGFEAKKAQRKAELAAEQARHAEELKTIKSEHVAPQTTKVERA